MKKSYLLLIMVAFLSLVFVESTFALTIDFRIRSAGSNWEAAIYSNGTDGAQIDLLLGWPPITTISYFVSWNALTGTATFIAYNPDSSELFNLSRTFSSFTGYAPKRVALQGFDDEKGDLAMAVDGGPSFSTSGLQGAVDPMYINVSNLSDFSLTGTFQFANDTFGNIGQNNLKGEIELKNVSPVPEPSTLLLLGSGLVSLWGLRKKFKK